MPRYWLLKTEPDAFSYDDLERSPDRTAAWDGVRNYQARNYLREMRPGDEAFIYHSNARPPAIAGVARVVREAHPDPTQFDPDSPYHDPKATRDAPRWSQVSVQAVRRLRRPLALDALRADPALNGLELLRRGSRLSVQPVSDAHWRHLLRLAEDEGGTA